MEKEKKPIYKKWWFWLIIVIVVVMISGGDSNNSNTVTVSTTENVSETTTESNTVDNNTVENTKVNAGEEVTTKDIKITFVSTNDYNDYDEYFGPKSGNKIIRAEFAFENISSSDISLNTLECYADGEKCEAYYSADDYKSPALESLSTGKKMTAVVYYEVPENAQSVILEYETNLWTSEKIEFIVK